MPAGEPNPDAPENVWAGNYDGQQFADALGMSWIAPLFSTRIDRAVNIPTLCASSPPSAPEFTTTDLLTGIIPGPGRDAADAKIIAFTDAYLWRTYCTAVDDPEPDPIVPSPEPDDLPVGTPPGGIDKMVRETWHWMEWLRKAIVGRKYHLGDESTVSGAGFIGWSQDDEGDWPVWPAGVIVSVVEQPPNGGRTEGGTFPVWYDLGWFSLADNGNAQSPIRLQHEWQMTYGSLARVNGFFYNLTPGVTITVSPLYPDTATPANE